VRRSVTRSACASLGLEPWDDPHNADPSYQRVRLRTEVLPLLEDVLQGGVAGALARTAELMRDDLEALDAWAGAALSGQVRPEWAVAGDPPSTGVTTGDGRLDAGALAALPRAVRTRVLRRWALAAGAGTLTAERTAALDALVVAWHGQGPVQLPGRLAVRRASGTLVLEPAAAAGDQAAPPGPQE
jgi:tRNA(Ile)-lysidine synthase